MVLDAGVVRALAIGRRSPPGDGDQHCRCIGRANATRDFVAVEVLEHGV